MPRLRLFMGIVLTIFHGSPGLAQTLFGESEQMLDLVVPESACAKALASPFEAHHRSSNEVRVQFAPEIEDRFWGQSEALEEVATYLALNHRLALDRGIGDFELIVSQPFAHKRLVKFKHFYTPSHTTLVVDSLRPVSRRECSLFWQDLARQERVPSLTLDLRDHRSIAVPGYAQPFYHIQVSPGVMLKLAMLYGFSEKDLRRILPRLKEVKMQKDREEHGPRLIADMFYGSKHLEIRIGIIGENLFLKTIYARDRQK